jgi:hypothetical protein
VVSERAATGSQGGAWLCAVDGVRCPTGRPAALRTTGAPKLTSALCYFAAAVLVAALAFVVAAPARAAEGIPDAGLAEAARSAKLADFDWNDEQCRRERTVEQWLADLGRDVVASVEWYGGACRLTNDVNPIDSGSDWCGGAEIRLKAPLSADDVPVVEVYFERPVDGRVAAPYAFRGLMLTADGEDYTRFSAHFEAGWESRFPGAVEGCEEE